MPTTTTINNISNAWRTSWSSFCLTVTTNGSLIGSHSSLKSWSRSRLRHLASQEYIRSWEHRCKFATNTNTLSGHRKRKLNELKILNKASLMQLKDKVRRVVLIMNLRKAEANTLTSERKPMYSIGCFHISKTWLASQRSTRMSCSWAASTFYYKYPWRYCTAKTSAPTTWSFGKASCSRL